MGLININAPVARISAGGTSANIAIPQNDYGSKTSIEVVNESDSIIYVKTGTSGVTATVNDRGILPNSDQVFSRNSDHTHIAAITAGGVSKSIAIYNSPGE